MRVHKLMTIKHGNMQQKFIW